MQPILSFDNIMSFIGLGSLVVMGVISILGTLNKEKQKISKEADEADDRLISLLKGTVDSLTKQVETLKNEVAILGTKVTTLQAENNMLRSILQGRDDKTTKFQEETIAANARTKETLEIIKEISKSSKETNKNIQQLYEIMNKYIQKL